MNASSPCPCPELTTSYMNVGSPAQDVKPCPWAERINLAWEQLVQNGVGRLHSDVIGSEENQRKRKGEDFLGHLICIAVAHINAVASCQSHSSACSCADISGMLQRWPVSSPYCYKPRHCPQHAWGWYLIKERDTCLESWVSPGETPLEQEQGSFAILRHRTYQVQTKPSVITC